MIGRHTNQPVFHFALEVPVQRKTIVVDFKTGKDVVTYSGKYNPKKSAPGQTSLALHRFSTKNMTERITGFQFIGIRNLREIGKKFSRIKLRHVYASFESMRRADHDPSILQRMQTHQPKIRRIRVRRI